MNVVNVSPSELQSKPYIEKNPSEEVIQNNSEVSMLKFEKKALEVELKSKTALLEESYQELVQVRRHVQDLKKVLQDLAEEPCQKCNDFSSELASSQKLLCSELKDLELSEQESIPDLVKRVLVLFNKLNENCAQLKLEVETEINSRLSTEEKVIFLQKRCEDLENEMDSAQKTLLSELKALSNNSSVEDLPLPSLVSEFLASVMEAQQHVASILESKIDDCTKEPEATLIKENENQKIIEELKSELKHYRDRNESLREALEDLKQEEHDALGLLGVVNKLKMLVGAMETVTYDELVSILENKLSKDLGADLEQQLSENKTLRSSMIDLDEQISEQKNMIMILEQSASEANQKLKINEENTRKLNKENAKERSVAEELRSEVVHKDELLGKLQKQLSELQNANERSLAEDLRVEIVHRDELVEKLKEQMSELQEKLDQMSAETKLVNTLKADLHSKEEYLLQLEAKLQQVLLDTATHQEIAEILRKENRELKMSVNVAESQQTLKVTEENSEKLREEIAEQRAQIMGMSSLLNKAYAQRDNYKQLWLAVRKE